MKKGVFVSVDGPNGSGKSFFIENLVKKLDCCFSVYQTKEPTPTAFGEFVKKNEGGLKGIQYAHLIWADRYYHMGNYILPELASGKIVISDRFVDSSFVLQGFDGVPYEKIWELNSLFQFPDLSIILVAEPNILADRLSKRDMLSAFEKQMTRQEEIDGYKKAAQFLESKGTPHIIYSNNTMDDFENNIEDAFRRISALAR